MAKGHLASSEHEYFGPKGVRIREVLLYLVSLTEVILHSTAILVFFTHIPLAKSA